MPGELPGLECGNAPICVGSEGGGELVSLRLVSVLAGDALRVADEPKLGVEGDCWRGRPVTRTGLLASRGELAGEERGTPRPKVVEA